MDYNRQRKEAFDMIEVFAEAASHKVEDVVFYVMRATGFSDKFIRNYIKINLDRNIFVVDKKTSILRIKGKFPNE